MPTQENYEKFENFCNKYQTRRWIQINSEEFGTHKNTSNSHIQSLKSDLHNGHGYMSMRFRHAPDTFAPFFKCNHMLADLEAAAALQDAGLSKHLNNRRAELLADAGVVDNTYAEMFYLDGFAYMHLFANEDKDDLFFKTQVVFEISTYSGNTYILDTYRGELLNEREGTIKTILDIRAEPMLRGQMALNLIDPSGDNPEYLVSSVITSIK